MTGQVFQMIPPLGEEDRRTTLFQRMEPIVQDEAVARLVLGERPIDTLDTGFRRSCGQPESCLASDEAMSERPPCRLAPRIHGEADRPQLHLQDWVVPIPPLRRGGQPYDVPGFDLG